MPKINLKKLDSGQVIEAVRKLPVLWDPSHKEYQIQGVRRTAWRHACASIYKNFYLMPFTTQKKIVQELRNKWTAVKTLHRIHVVDQVKDMQQSIDTLDFLIPTYGPQYKKDNSEAILGNVGESDNSTLKEYILIEVQEQVPENESNGVINEINKTKYTQQIDIAPTDILKIEQVLNNSKLPIETEVFDIEMAVNNTSEDTTINNAIKYEVTETTTNKEVLDQDLEISESMIKKEIIDDVEVNTNDSFQDVKISETLLQWDAAQREFNNEKNVLDDNGAFFAFLQSSMNKLNNSQKCIFRIKSLQLLEEIKRS